MRGAFASILVSALLVLGTFAKSGCSHVSTGQVVTELGNLATAGMDCGSGAIAGYDGVRQSIHDGGAGWLSAALGVGKALWCIVYDELKAHGCSIADASGNEAGAFTCPAPMSAAEQQRIKFLVALLKLTESVKLPPQAVAK